MRHAHCYVACPFDVVIKYENEVMRLDVGNSFYFESVKNTGMLFLSNYCLKFVFLTVLPVPL